MRYLAIFVRHVINFARRAAAGYEPVAARAFVSSIFAALALGGIGTGELPGWANMVLALATILIPTALSLSARAKVTPVALVPADPGRLPGDEDLHPEPTVVEENPDDDLLEEPGQHKRLD